MLADASAALMQEYGGAIDPRAVLWANFGMAAITVYGPRVAALTLRKNRERYQREQQQQQQAAQTGGQ